MTRRAECPGLETLAALIDGRLPPVEAEPVRAHVAGCDDCFDLTRETMQFLSHDDVGRADDAPAADVARPVFGLTRAAGWWIAAAAIVVVVAGLQVMRPGREDGVADLVAAVGGRRLVEPRLTGGFAYAPPPSPWRGPSPLDRTNLDDLPVIDAALKIRAAAARRDAGQPAIHALGLADLVLGDPGAAVESLESAVRARPADARALSDLAAAYLTRAGAARRADDFVLAIDAARHALALDPRCDEARFNFALAIEKQIESGAIATPGPPIPGAESTPGAGSTPADGAASPDPARAIEAWDDYLKHDAVSPWADEARRRLDALRRQSELLPVSPDPSAVEAAARQGDPERTTALVRGNPRIGHEVLERRLLAAWAEAQEGGRDAEAAAALDAAGVLSRSIERVSGDRLGIDALAAIAAAPPGRESRAAMAASVAQYARSFARYDGGDMQSASAGFRAAAAGLDRGRSPLRWSASLYAAICDYYAAPGAEVRRRVDALADDLAGRPYLFLLARARWMQGLLGAVAGDLSRSLEHYGAALSLFERIGELDGVASANFLIAENLDLVGDPEEAWGHRATALGLASRADADRRRSILLEATLAALAQHRPWAALTFHEPLFEPWSAADPGARSEAYKTRARIHAESGDIDGALSDLTDAERMLSSVADPDLRRRYAAEIAESRGTTLLSRDPAGAVEPLRQAGEYFASIGSTSRLAGLRLDLGRAHEALGSYAESESDYIGGIATLEETYSHLLLKPHRVSFVDRTWLLFEAMIRLEAENRDRPDLAFAYAERARRAELLTPQACLASPDTGGAPDAAAIARRLPDGVTVVYMTVVPDRLLRWVFRDGRVEFRPQPVVAGEIAALVQGARGAAASGDEPAFRDAAGKLYDLLIRPVEPLLAGSLQIRFVPDRLLDDVPFAALLDRDSDSFLVERYATGVSPTAASLVSRCSTGDHAGPGARVVVVGNPAFDEIRHADLVPLPGAEAEARQVASLYPNASLLIGDRATAGRFLSAIATAEIVHFAGHALTNERYPLLSALVLAPDPESGHPGPVTAFDLQQAAMPRARLVVLGACGVAGGGSARAGGAFNLARPFLAAGVPEIVGTLWAVRDREAHSILVDLHREYRRGSSAVEGLRQAQLAALRGPDPAARSPLSWGAYVVDGTVLRSGDSLKKEAS